MKPESQDKPTLKRHSEWTGEEIGGFSVLDLLLVLVRSKKTLLLHFLAITAVALATSYIIPKNYKSTTLFLPPNGESFHLPAMALGLGLNFSDEPEFTSQQVETLLGSRYILEQIVNKYDLMTVYKTKKKKNNLEAALKKLRKNIKLKLETEAGLTHKTVVHYSLSVIDKDGRRSADIANDMILLLNQTMDKLSHEQENYTVNFIGTRLDSVITAKRQAQIELAEFQKANKIYSPEMKEQVLASVAAISELQKQKMMAEMERDLLLIDREPGNREVRFAQRKVAEISSKIKQLETGRKADVLPGLDFAVDIAYKYMDMVKENEILVKLELLLRQQYEENRIKNARRAPVVRVIDQAVPPQWKNFPKKAVVVGIMVCAYMFCLLIFIFARYGLSQSSDTTKMKIDEFRSALKL